MKGIPVIELREKTLEELDEMVEKERAVLHEMRRKLVFREVTDSNAPRVVRHNIARILTIRDEKAKEQQN